MFVSCIQIPILCKEIAMIENLLLLFRVVERSNLSLTTLTIEDFGIDGEKDTKKTGL